MKNTGIVRKLDSLGRIVIPIELLRLYNIHEKDTLEFYIDEENEQIMMKSYLGSGCFFCKNVRTDMSFFKGKVICQDCIKEVSLGITTPVPINEDQIVDTEKVDSNTVTETISKEQQRTNAVNIDDKASKRNKRHKREELATKLLEEHRKQPELSQVQLAKKFGVSAPYVNVLVQELRNRGEWDKDIRRAK